MKKILVTDDDDLERAALLDILKAEPDWQVVQAADGQTALNMLCDGLKPQLCLFDLRMPKMNGLELLQRIRRDSTLRDLHVAVTSATRDRDTIIALSKLRIDGYLLKPYDAPKILATVRQIMATLPAAVEPVVVTRNLLAKTILVVEDDELERAALCAIIKTEPGWEIVEATSGIGALERLRDGLWPDLCLIDLRMPQLDGHWLLQQIRGDPSLQRLRVMVLSGEKDREKVIPLSRLGIAGYLLKPANPEKVRAILREIAGVPPTSAPDPHDVPPPPPASAPTADAAPAPTAEGPGSGGAPVPAATVPEMQSAPSA